MMHSKKKQARRLSEYVDSVITRARAEDTGPCDNDPALGELAVLASKLSEVRLVMPEQLPQDVFRRVARERIAEEPRVNGPLWRMSRVSSIFDWRPLKLQVPIGIACALIVAFTVWFSKAVPVSAATVLARSETALASLTGPDEVLHRRWSTKTDSTCSSSGDAGVRTGILDEWLETNGRVRSAGRSIKANGALRWAYTTGGAENRHLVYFPPSPSHPQGLLNIEPTREEYYAAVQRFPADRQPVLRAYLDRGYLVEPVVSDQQFNWRAITDQTNIEKLPRVILTMEKANRENGEAYYRVRIAEDRRPWFWWSAAGEPAVWLEHQETVRFISAGTYLSWRVESKRQDDQGCWLTTTRELVTEERVSKSKATSDVFAWTIPSGTPARRQSASQLLGAVLAALDGTNPSGPRQSLE